MKPTSLAFLRKYGVLWCPAHEVVMTGHAKTGLHEGCELLVSQMENGRIVDRRLVEIMEYGKDFSAALCERVSSEK